MSYALTAKQADILAYIKTCIGNGMPPTRREIKEAFGFKSENSVDCHLKAMAGKRAIRLLPGKSRGIQVTA